MLHLPIVRERREKCADAAVAQKDAVGTFDDRAATHYASRTHDAEEKRRYGAVRVASHE